MKRSRKSSVILFVSALVISQVGSIMCILGLVNLSSLINNLKFPSGYVSLNIDTSNPQDMIFQMSYTIKNSGVYELTDIIASVDIRLNYINESNGANITTHIFSKRAYLENCRPFYQFEGLFVGDSNNYNIIALDKFYNEFNSTTLYYFFLDLEFDAKYFMKLIHFRFFHNNLNLYKI